MKIGGRWLCVGGVFLAQSCVAFMGAGKMACQLKVLFSRKRTIFLVLSSAIWGLHWPY